MPTPILMPALSPTMEEGTLTKWHVQEGASVSSGDVIAEIETDKATMEVEAVDEGLIGKITIAEGTQNVKVNTLIAVLLEEGETEDQIDLAALQAGGTTVESADITANTPRAAPAQPSTTPQQQAPTPEGRRLFASPLARRIAKNNALDLSCITGTGPHGRIIRRDVENALKNGTGKAAPAAAFTPAIAGVDVRLYPVDSYVAVKNDGMRKTIAKRLTQSFNHEVPHFPLMVDVELDALLTARKAMNDMSPPKGEEGFYKLSVNDFLTKANAMALMKVPGANATYTDEAILLHKNADIGIAVAIEGGLITPIVWQAQTKGLIQISNEIKDMAARARTKKLKPEEYQGGTFSISNLGMYGVKAFASIVNQPQGAIMSVGAGEERAVVKQGQLCVATMMTVTLTCDHRVVDGGVGAEFLQAFRQFVEHPSSMLL